MNGFWKNTDVVSRCSNFSDIYMGPVTIRIRYVQVSQQNIGRIQNPVCALMDVKEDESRNDLLETFNDVWENKNCVLCDGV